MSGTPPGNRSWITKLEESLEERSPGALEVEIGFRGQRELTPPRG
jgi:hypothetical protein